MPVKIICDSTCDLSAEIIERLDVTVIPLTIQLGNKVLRDGVDVNKENFFARIKRIPSPPVSAAPTQKQFEDVFAELTKNPANEIVAILLSSK
ncbi:MAG: DegV family protein, partial [Chloroflexi bacterium]|nr:DegV family protein [Chloroflexota bacterium]